MLKKSASVVLASFRSSTYPRGYASGPSLAAFLLDGHFEHPAIILLSEPSVRLFTLYVYTEFFISLLGKPF
jgi:hypothetical protein